MPCLRASRAEGNGVLPALAKAGARAKTAIPTRSLNIRIANKFRLPARMSDGAVARRTYLIRKLPQRSTGVGIERRLPCRSPLFECGRIDLEIERTVLGVHHDDIAVLNEADRAADGGLRTHMADAEAARGAREAPVGDERDLVTRALAVERSRGGQHLAHARAALGALVADDEHFAFLVGACFHGAEGILLAVEAAGGTTELEVLQTSDLHDRAVGRERAPEAHDAAGRADRVRYRIDDLLLGVELHGREVLGHR